MWEASYASGLTDLVSLNISLTKFFIFVYTYVNKGILKHIGLKNRTNSTFFSATDTARVFLKYVLVVPSTLSSLVTKGIQYDVVVK